MSGMLFDAHNPGFPDGTVIPQHLYGEQLVCQAPAACQFAFEQRRGPVVQYDKIGFLAFLEISDLLLKVQYTGASQCGLGTGGAQR